MLAMPPKNPPPLLFDCVELGWLVDISCSAFWEVSSVFKMDAEVGKLEGASSKVIIVLAESFGTPSGLEAIAPIE